MEYLLAAALVFAVNLLPAFGPPTWAVLVLLQVNLDLEPAAMVLVGAVSAACGRLLLALGARRTRGLMSAERLDNLDLVAERLTDSRTRGLGALALFLVSPLPSAQLFIGAGLLDAPLRPLIAAFLVGRLIAYSIYVGLATVATDNLGELVGETLRSPLGIAIQLLMLGGLAALLKIDWTRVLGGRNTTRHP
jgi:membrane protein YqaA with SNARE-associated domain